jgi:hypothetical protein
MMIFGRTENLFDVLMQYINFRYFRFIAVIAPFANLVIANTNIIFVRKIVDG